MKRFCIHQWPCCSSVFSFTKINDLLYQLNHYQSSSKYILIFILKKSSKSPSAWSVVTGYYFIFQHHDLKYLWFPWRHDCSFHHHYVWKINNVKQIGDKYSDTMGFSQIVRSLDSVTIFNTKLPLIRAHWSQDELCFLFTECTFWNGTRKTPR